MYIFTLIFNDTVNVWLNFFGLQLKIWKFIQCLYHMQFCLSHCSFLDLTVTSDGDVEALMGLISGFKNLGTGLNPDCYFRHSKVIPNFDLMTAFV